MSDGLDDVIGLMEELLEEYIQQDHQLNGMHKTLSLLKYGYNSLRQQLSRAECSSSELLGLSRSAAVGLEQHVELMETKVENIKSCCEEAQQSLETIELFAPGGDKISTCNSCAYWQTDKTNVTEEVLHGCMKAIFAILSFSYSSCHVCD